MIHAYDEQYLEGAMIRLGDMLEYACLDCGYHPDVFWKMFLLSEFSKRFEIGDASVVSGRSGVETAYMVLSQIDHRDDFPVPRWREYRSDLYWSAWVLAYYQWYTARSFSDIWEDVSIRMMQKLYVSLHEADIMKSVEALEELKKTPEKRTIRELRLVRGLTQQELANRAHMSISQVQRLEYGERKVENLSLKSAKELAKALRVGVEVLN